MGLVAPKQSFVELLVSRPAVDVPFQVALGPTYHPSKQVSQQPGPPQAPPSRLQLGALQTFPRASLRRPPSGSILGSPRPPPGPGPSVPRSNPDWPTLAAAGAVPAGRLPLPSSPDRILLGLHFSGSCSKHSGAGHSRGGGGEGGTAVPAGGARGCVDSLLLSNKGPQTWRLHTVTFVQMIVWLGRARLEGCCPGRCGHLAAALAGRPQVSGTWAQQWGTVPQAPPYGPSVRTARACMVVARPRMASPNRHVLVDEASGQVVDTARQESCGVVLTLHLPQWRRQLPSFSGTVLRCSTWALRESPEGLSPGALSALPQVSFIDFSLFPGSLSPLPQ